MGKNRFKLTLLSLCLTPGLTHAGMAEITNVIDAMQDRSGYHVNDLILVSELQRKTSTNLAVEQAKTALASELVDDDADDTVEASAFLAAIAGHTPPVGGGFIPVASMAVKSDGYGIPLGYCVWDNGTSNSSANRSTGDNPGSNSSLSFVVLSSGQNRTFDTSCADAKVGNFSGDDVYRVVTLGQGNLGIANNQYFGKPVPDLTALMALDTTSTQPGEMRVVLEDSAIYAWLDPDNDTVYEWTALTSDDYFNYGDSNGAAAGGEFTSTPFGVGIGNKFSDTSLAPGSTLEVDGTARFVTGTGLVSTTGNALVHVGSQEAASGTVGEVARLAIQPYGRTDGPFNLVARDTASAAFLDIKYANLAPILSISGSDNRVGLNAAEPEGTLHIRSADGNDANTEVIIESDPDNAGGEDHNPQVIFKQDAGLYQGRVGLAGSDDSDYDGARANALYLEGTGTTAGSGKIQFVTGRDAGDGLSKGAARMTILGDGNIGIGTQFPAAKLVVTGADNAMTGPVMLFNAQNADQVESGRIRFTENGSNFRGGYVHYDGLANALVLGINDDALSYNAAADKGVITVPRDNGYVGINNADPFSSLHIRSANGDDADTVVTIEADPDNAGGEEANPRLRLQQDGGGVQAFFGLTGTTALEYTGSLNNAAYLEIAESDASLGSFQFVTGRDNDLPGSKGEARMTIRADGRIGIGTNNPNYTLSLAGPDNFTNGPIMSFQGDAANQSEAGRIIFKEDASNFLGSYIHYDAIDDAMYIGTNSSNAAGYNAATGKNVLTMKRDSGYLGINHSAPDSTLHVLSADGAASDTLVVIESDAGNLDEDANPQLILRQDGGFIEGVFALASDVDGVTDEYIGQINNAIYLEAAEAPGGGGNIQFVVGRDASDVNSQGTAMMSITPTEILMGLNDGVGSNVDVRINGSEVVTINGREVGETAATDLTPGWYTVAVNSGDRAVGRFGIVGERTGYHQNVIFYAGHLLGDSNSINVLSSDSFGAPSAQMIRIMEGGQTDGAMLQVYVGTAQNGLSIYQLGDNLQDSGWELVPWVPDGTNPGTVTNYAALTNEAALANLDLVAKGGIATTGGISIGQSDWGVTAATTNDGISNAITLGLNPSEQLAILAQTTNGTDPTICGAGDADCYIFNMTDSNANNPDGSIIFGGTGVDDVFEQYLKIDGTGKVHVQTSSSATLSQSDNAFTVTTQGGTWGTMGALGAGYFDFRTNAASGFYFHNTVGASGGFGIASDKRFKKNIQSIESAMEKIRRVRGVTYHLRTDEFKDWGFAEDMQYGVIAQELQSVFPEMVQVDKEGYMSVSYTELIPVLVKASQELDQKNQEQDARIDKNETAIQENQSLIDRLQREAAHYTARIKELEAREGIQTNDQPEAKRVPVSQPESPRQGPLERFYKAVPNAIEGDR